MTADGDRKAAVDELQEIRQQLERIRNAIHEHVAGEVASQEPEGDAQNTAAEQEAGAPATAGPLAHPEHAEETGAGQGLHDDLLGEDLVYEPAEVPADVASSSTVPRAASQREHGADAPAATPRQQADDPYLAVEENAVPATVPKADVIAMPFRSARQPEEGDLAEMMSGQAARQGQNTRQEETSPTPASVSMRAVLARQRLHHGLAKVDDETRGNGSGMHSPAEVVHLSGRVRNRVQAALGRLERLEKARDALGGDEGLRQLVADLLEPMLQQWLEENLPEMVQDRLAVELRRHFSIEGAQPRQEEAPLHRLRLGGR